MSQACKDWIEAEVTREEAFSALARMGIDRHEAEWMLEEAIA